MGNKSNQARKCRIETRLGNILDPIFRFERELLPIRGLRYDFCTRIFTINTSVLWADNVWPGPCRIFLGARRSPVLFLIKSGRNLISRFSHPDSDRSAAHEETAPGRAPRRCRKTIISDRQQPATHVDEISDPDAAADNG